MHPLPAPSYTRVGQDRGAVKGREMTTLWAAVIRGVSLSFLSKRSSAGVRDWHLPRFLCPRTGLLEQMIPAARENAHREADLGTVDCMDYFMD